MNKEITDLGFLGHSPTFPSYRPQTAWLRHGPFAAWLIKAARPKTLVELGTHFGYSYFAFCEVVKSSEVGTRCFAVDTWQGDDHAGFYGDEVFASVQEENKKYKAFSSLLHKSFDEAVKDFDDQTVDLLHIDGRHGYDDVKHDFQMWKPKLAPNSIVLFHDTCVEQAEFGVKKYWAELVEEYDSINFLFQHGLGVLFIGENHSSEINSLKYIARSRGGKELCNALFYSYSQIFLESIEVAKLKRSLKQPAANYSSSSINFKKHIKQISEQKEIIVTLQADVQTLINEVVSLRRHPTRALGDLAKYKVLRGLAESKLPLTERARNRFLRSSEKRNPNNPDPRYTIHDKVFSTQLSTLTQKNTGIINRSLHASGLAAINKARGVSFREALPEFATFERLISRANDVNTELKSLHGLITRSDQSWQGPVIIPKRDGQQVFDPSKVVIYTALFGNYDQLPPLLTMNDGLDFVCFTDQRIESAGWTVINMEKPLEDTNLAAKYFKVHPHKVFPEKDYSLFVDANTVFCGRVGRFIDRWLSNENFAMWRHPDRSCMYDEAEAIILYNRAAATKIALQMAEYEETGILKSQGLYECSFIWRRHHQSNVKAFMDAWWSEILKYTNRDQPSFYYLAHNVGPKPKVLPRALGTSRENIVFFKVPHRQSSKLVCTVRSSKPKIVFLHDTASERMGSTIMRSVQLPRILQGELGEKVEITTTKDLSNVQNSIVVVGKRLMSALSDEMLGSLKNANVAIAADPIDQIVTNKDCQRFDIILAASIGAFRQNSIISPSTAHHLLTHHADPRISVAAPPIDKLRIGYFGELANTLGMGQLDHLINYYRINTSEPDEEWLDQLRNYNAHFAVRQNRVIDGPKPFTKGFTAAKCGAVIICDRNQGDNLLYLGEDYPFFIENIAPELIELSLGEFSRQFGGAEWVYAQKIMADVKHRSSDAWIAGEFLQLVKDVW